MAPEDRRAMIAEASIPLFIEYGPGLTTRQIAEHLGIAEGTIFRAFGDKDSLIRATVGAFFDQARRQLPSGLVDSSLPLAEKVALLVSNARIHMRGVFAMLALMDPHDIPSVVGEHDASAFDEAVAAAFAPDAAQLSLPLDRLGVVVRMATLAAWAPHMGGQPRLDEDELSRFILYGIAGQPRGKD